MQMNIKQCTYNLRPVACATMVFIAIASTGCATKGWVENRIAVERNAMEARMARIEEEQLQIASLVREQNKLAAALREELHAVNERWRGSIERASATWSDLQAVQRELAQVNGLVKRFQVTRSGSMLLLTMAPGPDAR
jgi:hypothetical protein